LKAFEQGGVKNQLLENTVIGYGNNRTEYIFNMFVELAIKQIDKQVNVMKGGGYIPPLFYAPNYFQIIIKLITNVFYKKHKNLLTFTLICGII
jgi:hypothetical protein